MRRLHFAALSLLPLAACTAQSPVMAPVSRASEEARADTVAKSDAFARRLVEVDARFDPESLILLGDTHIDQRVPDLEPQRNERAMRDYRDIEIGYRQSRRLRIPT